MRFWLSEEIASADQGQKAVGAPDENDLRKLASGERVKSLAQAGRSVREQAPLQN